MKNIALYRILSYILLPFGGLFAMIALFGILVALSNPILLLNIFFIACVALYIFSSFTFLNKAIIRQTRCKPFLKDFVRVNAFVSIFVAALSIFNSVAILIKPQILKLATQQMLSMQASLATGGLNEAALLNAFKGVTLFIGILCILLLAHALLSLRFLKLFKHAFSEE
jgi:hypothetical protein